MIVSLFSQFKTYGQFSYTIYYSQIPSLWKYEAVVNKQKVSKHLERY